MAKEEKKKAKVKRPTALKRELQNEKKRQRNKERLSQIRTAIRRFDEALPQKDVDQTNEKLSAVYSLLDKAAGKGLIKLNKASRIKANLTAKVHAKTK